MNWSQANVTSGNARSIWDGVGSNHLTLKAPLVPAGSTPAQVAAHIRDRVDGISDTVCDYQAAPIAPELVGAIVRELS